MDPQLWEEIERGDADQNIRAIVRLYPGTQPPSTLQIVSQFGDIMTCRLKRRDIVAVRAHPSVRSLKASRGLEPARFGSAQTVERIRRGVPRRPNVRETGRGVIVGVVDYGCDFAHSAFRTSDGSSRIKSLWHQSNRRSSTRAPDPFGQGRAWSKDDIDAALSQADPYRALGYHPSRKDSAGRRKPSHGTHVADIATGSGLTYGPTGMAPGAELVFVHVDSGDTSGLLNFGDSVGVLEAIDYITRVAGDQPTAINISMGRHGGPHDGTTLIELAMDHLLMSRRGLSIAQSAGNYHNAEIHCAGRLQSRQSQLLEWRILDGASRTKELEIWLSADDSIDFVLTSPAGTRWDVPAGARIELEEGGRTIGRAYHRQDDPGNGDTHIDVFFYDQAAAVGRWTGQLVPRKILDGRWHAWLERHGARALQTRFTRGPVRNATTGGTIAHGRGAIQVAAHTKVAPYPVTSFSSAGPARDGRSVPMIAAPGEDIWAARSATSSRASGKAVMSMPGTSMAAPHVTGTIALMLEAAPTLTQRQIRGILRNTALPMPTRSSDLGHRSTWGRLNAQAAVIAARAFATSVEEALPVFPDTETVSENASHIITADDWALIAGWVARGMVPNDGAGALPNGVSPLNAERLPLIAIDAARTVAQALLNHRTRSAGGPMSVRALPRRSTITNRRLDPWASQIVTAMPLTTTEWQNVGAFFEGAANSNRTGTSTSPAFGTNANANLLNAAHFIACQRLSSFPGLAGPALACSFPTSGPSDPGVAILVQQLQKIGTVIDWPQVSMDERRVYIMQKLITTHGFPVNSAAGIVGNLQAESRLLPNAVESGRATDPRFALAYRGPRQRFAANEIMTRSKRGNIGPRMGGIGLAQWTHRDRRAAFFGHRFQGISMRGYNIYLMDVQLDLLVMELASSYGRLNRLLRNATTTLDDAAAEFVYDFERPCKIFVPHPSSPKCKLRTQRRRRTAPEVITIFNERRSFARSALRAYQAALAPATTDTFAST